MKLLTKKMHSEVTYGEGNALYHRYYVTDLAAKRLFEGLPVPTELMAHAWGRQAKMTLLIVHPAAEGDGPGRGRVHTVRPESVVK